MTMTIVYIAGPMTGHEDFNYPAFHAAGDMLAEYGFNFISGAHKGGECDTPPAPGEEKPWKDYMRKAVQDLSYCDLIYLLDGWEDSRGARLEVEIAQSIGIPRLILEDLSKPKTPPEPVPLPEPQDCKTGEYYVVRDNHGWELIGERDTEDDVCKHPWDTTGGQYVDDQITILARLTPDRKVQ